MDTSALTEPAIVPFAGLQPDWSLPHATEEGYFRWVVSFVGGGPGKVNVNPETGYETDKSVLGLMHLPVGQRQFALHIHTVTETYIILQGRAESVEPGGRRHQMEQFDCIAMPAGAPHAVRNTGEEDVWLLWVHDGVEDADAAHYFDNDDPPGDFPHIEYIAWDSVVPTPGNESTAGGHLRSMKTWLSGGNRQADLGYGTGPATARIGLGSLAISGGNAEVAAALPTPRLNFVVSGRAAVVDAPGLGVAGPNDVIILPADRPNALRAVGPEPLHIIWVLEGA
jgi:mannose-6-phosphate isomerase-like protein (cupin superfamily)